MLKLNHPNIVALHETFESDHFFDLVMENCVGGELFQRLVSRKTYPEAEARDVVRSVCNAVAYCHRRNVVHRDLKPENLLYADTSDNAPIKIADFGFAQKVRCAGLASDAGLAGKRAVVFGGTSGIGLATSIRLRDLGCEVSVCV